VPPWRLPGMALGEGGGWRRLLATWCDSLSGDEQLVSVETERTR
jgi:hypothetical protein